LKTEVVKQLINNYCKEELNEDYRQICIKLYVDLIEYDPVILNRGNDSIWAAAIIWAIGSINFLNDKFSEPYAT